MVKEKIRISDEKSKNKEFYLEITGVLILIFLLVILTELGSIGLGFKIFLKILFGEWYLLFIFLLIILGIKLLIFHKGLNIKKLPFQGFILLFTCLMLLSHISVYKFLININKNPLSGLFNLYSSYIKNYSNDFVFGGGIIGGLLFLGIYYIVGEIGLILITLLLLSLSLIFLSNNSIKSFYKKIRFDKLKLNKSLIKVKDYFKNIDLSNIKDFKTHKINISYLSDYESSFNYNLQINKSNEINILIKNILNGLNVEYKQLDFITGYLYTKYNFIIIHNFNLEIFKNKLNQVLETSVYCKLNNNNLEVEVNNQFKEIITLKNMWLKKEKNLIPIGINLEKEISYYDFNINKNILILLNNKENIAFIKSFLISNFLYNQDINLYILDNYQEYTSLKFILNTKSYDNDISLFNLNLEKISNILDKRMEIFNMLKIEEYSKLNNKSEELKNIPRIFIIINGLEFIEKSNIKENIYNKLIYFSQVGEKYGIYLLCIMKNIIKIPSMLKTLLTTKIIFKQDSYLNSVEFLDSDYAIYLNETHEYILKYKDEIKRLQIPFIIDNDYDLIIKKL